MIVKIASKYLESYQTETQSILGLKSILASQIKILII